MWHVPSPSVIRGKSMVVSQATTASHWTTGQAGVSGQDGRVRPFRNEAGCSLVVDDLALQERDDSDHHETLSLHMFCSSSSGGAAGGIECRVSSAYPPHARLDPRQ